LGGSASTSVPSAEGSAAQHEEVAPVSNAGGIANIAPAFNTSRREILDIDVYPFY
jgi:hypothetical protein